MDLFARTFLPAATDAGLDMPTISRHLPVFRRCLGADTVLLVSRCTRADRPLSGEHVLVLSRHHGSGPGIAAECKSEGPPAAVVDLHPAGRSERVPARLKQSQRRDHAAELGPDKGCRRRRTGSLTRISGISGGTS